MIKNNLKTIEEDEIYNLFNYEQKEHSVNDIIHKINDFFESPILRKASDDK